MLTLKVRIQDGNSDFIWWDYKPTAFDAKTPCNEFGMKFQQSHGPAINWEFENDLRPISAVLKEGDIITMKYTPRT